MTIRPQISVYTLIISAGMCTCQHDPIPPDNPSGNSSKCIPIPPADGTGDDYISDTFQYLAPDYNPINQNEISYIIRDSRTLASSIFALDRSSGSKSLIASKVYYWPKWSINGVIVFNGTDNNIRTIDVQTKKISLLTSGGCNLDPNWSPDGRLIIYDSNLRVGIMNADGTNRRPLFNSAGFRFPTWSPDGKKIALLKEVAMTPDSIYTEIVVYDTSSHIFTTLGKSQAPSGEGVDWFPNSDDLVWATSKGVYVTSLNGTQRLLKEGCNARSYLYPSVSPDGKSIIVCRADSKLISENTVFDEYSLYIMNADGSDERKVEF